MSRSHPPSGVVLAGGRGRRLGRPKGSIVAGGESWARRAATTLAPLCRCVWVSTGRAESDPAPGWPRLVDDPPPGRGPLAGIARAFRAAREGDLLVLACDYPLVTTDLLARLLERAKPGDDLVLPVDERGRVHPLVALWAGAAAARVGEALSRKERRVFSLLPQLQVRRLRAADLGLPAVEGLLLNVNRPADLERTATGSRCDRRESRRDPAAHAMAARGRRGDGGRRTSG